MVGVCHDLSVFGIELADLRTVRHGRGNYTTWLAPKSVAAFIKLQAALQRA